MTQKENVVLKLFSQPLKNNSPKPTICENFCIGKNNLVALKHYLALSQHLMYPMCNSKSESSLKIELISEKSPQKPKIVENFFGLQKEFTCGN